MSNKKFTIQILSGIHDQIIFTQVVSVPSYNIAKKRAESLRKQHKGNTFKVIPFK